MGAPDGSVGRLSPGDKILGTNIPAAVVALVLVVLAVVVVVPLALLIIRLERWRSGDVAGREVTTPPTVST